jgi:tRNA pseudouridine32 synthase/23S rRNA pseudouridine746 synthase
MSELHPGTRICVEQVLTESVANISDYLAVQTGLPKARIKIALTCGALQIKKRQGKFQRLRRATANLPAGTSVKFHYDVNLISIKPAQPRLVADFKAYSAWFKPPGLMAQGNDWGDHCSMLRQVEIHFNNQRKVFLVHRLDRDACGLMLVAHDKSAAGKLGALFAGREIQKQYLVRVAGVIEPSGVVIDTPLDGKNARTQIQVIENTEHSCLLTVSIDTGRKHQIRRHLSQIGHSVIGDALYGVKNPKGLHLAATNLMFHCPVQGRSVSLQIAPDCIATYWK